MGVKMLVAENHPKPSLNEYPLLGVMAGILVAMIYLPYWMLIEKLEKLKE